jgi:hypothetical protein
MLDRLKGAPSEPTDPDDRKKDERAFDSNLPRFQPQPGGFGRRTTPVGPTPVGPMSTSGATAAAQKPTWETSVGDQAAEDKPAAQPQFRKPAAGFTRPSNDTGPALGDIPTRIADWLMRELTDERGIHCETLLTAIGALAGYAAQQALWEGMVKPGKLAIQQAFKVVETPSGETYFFGEPLDIMLASMEPKHLSIWKIVAGGVLAQGGEHLPDMASLLRHCEATAGTSQFGLPRLPDDHLPSMLPRIALDRYWPGARLFLTLADPLTWPSHAANAAQKLMQAMKGAIAPDLAVKIVMEAAVPMSRVDPTTVPNN